MRKYYHYYVAVFTRISNNFLNFFCTIKSRYSFNLIRTRMMMMIIIMIIIRENKRFIINMVII